jgi:beta-glucanase (GH16 family)
VPNGIPGTWALAFDDEFTGTSLDTSKWAVASGTSWSASGNTSDASNIIMRNPGLTLRQASASSGVQIMTNYTLPVGGCCEASCWFPGSGAPTPGMAIYNWPAWWTSCNADWPAGGEIDIAEGLSGTLTCNYHSTASPNDNGPEPGPSGAWSNSWHTYGMLRTASLISWYFDGKVVRTVTPNDNGKGQNLLLDITTGSFGGPVSVFGAASDMKVAYVRAWTPG